MCLGAGICKGVTRIHKFTLMPNMSTREALTHVRCEVLIAVTVVWLVTRDKVFKIGSSIALVRVGCTTLYSITFHTTVICTLYSLSF